MATLEPRFRFKIFLLNAVCIIPSTEINVLAFGFLYEKECVPIP